MAMTKERLEKLQADRAEAEAALIELRGTTEHDLWARELDVFEEAYAEHMRVRQLRREAPDGAVAGTLVSKRSKASRDPRGSLSGRRRRLSGQGDFAIRAR